MKTTLLTIAFLAALPTMVLAETNIAPLNIRMLTVRGENSDDHSEVLSEFTAVNTSQTRKYLKEFSIFAVRQCNDPFHPNGKFGSLLVQDGKIPIYFENMAKAAAFLFKRIGPVNTKEEAEAALLLVPDLFSYKVITSPLPFHDGQKPEVEKESEWTRVFKRTDTGPYEA